MKRYINITMALVSLMMVVSCSDFLHRLPTTSITYEGYFNSEEELKLYANGFNSYIPGASVMTSDLDSDNIETGSYDAFLAGVRVVPASGGGWDWTWLRNFNILLANYQKADCDEQTKNYYAALARFYRAWFYFEKIKLFGDVPWYDKPLETSSPELYKKRDSRVFVGEKILEDLDFAISHLKSDKDQTGISKWTALALKSRFCLYEGTYLKYHTELGYTEHAEMYLRECEEASMDLMENGGYKIYYTGAATDYRDIFTSEKPNSEVILAKIYNKGLSLVHSANYVFLAVSGASQEGFNKQFMDSYLMRDGSFFSSQPDYERMSFVQECTNRDLRLYQTVRTPGYTRIGGTTKLLPDFDKAATGYHMIKWVTGTADDAYNGSVNAASVFRYSEVLLNYAEAKAELGEFDQAVADLTVNQTRKRGGLPALKVVDLKVDPAQQKLYPGISDPAILEVRRERRVELVMEGLRWNDLMRWKRGPLVAQKFRGMYFEKMGIQDLDGDGKDDFCIVNTTPVQKQPGITYLVLGDSKALSNGTYGYLMAQPRTIKNFDEGRDYLYPIPTNEIVNNPDLEQNPKW